MSNLEIAYLLELRLRLRRNAEGRALVDRCLRLVAMAAEADANTFVRLQRQAEAIGEELAVRYGAPLGATVQ